MKNSHSQVTPFDTRERLLDQEVDEEMNHDEELSPRRGRCTYGRVQQHRIQSISLLHACNPPAACCRIDKFSPPTSVGWHPGEGQNRCLSFTKLCEPLLTTTQLHRYGSIKKKKNVQFRHSKEKLPKMATVCQNTLTEPNNNFQYFIHKLCKLYGKNL